MAILTQKPKDYRPGDSVTASVVNDTVDTAVNAHKTSVEASEKAQRSKNESEIAIKDAEQAVIDSAEAKTLSHTANKNAHDALTKATDVLARADRGEFNDNAVLVETSGMYGFQVIDGDLWLSYSGESQPDFEINNNGELVYKY
jgi:hypothetical protein